MSTLFTNVFLAVLALISGLLAARTLGPTGRGELAAIQAWPTFLATVAVLGIPEALVYYSARKPNRSGQWLATAVITAILACIPFMIFGYLLMPVLLKAQSTEVIAAARAYLWILPIMASVGMIPNVFRGRNDIGAWNFLRVLPSIVWVIVLVIGVTVLQPSPEIMAVGYLIGFSLLLIPYMWAVYRRVPGPFSGSKELVKPLVVFGLPLMLSIIPYTLNVRLDQMLMSALLEPRLLGLYAVAVAWSSAVTPLLSVLPAVMMPKIASNPDHTDQIRQLAQIVRLGILFAALICGLILIFTPLLLPLLFGIAYRPAIPAAMILSVAAGIFGITALLESSAQSLGFPKLILIAETIGLVITLGLLAVLLRPYQIIGAAIASLSSYFVVMITMILLIQARTGIRASTLLLIKRSDFELLIEKFRTLRASLISNS